MTYVDGFLLSVPQKRLNEYKKMARLAAKVWKEYGALDYKEAEADDIDLKGFASFSKAASAKRGEKVIFSYIVYRNKRHRDSVNKKVMTDKRLMEACSGKDMPFDVKRMAYGGFKVIVSS